MNILNPRRNDRGDTEGIFIMEFPLMQWLGAMLYEIFGRHLIITRIYMFIVGLLTLLGIYKLLNTLFNNTLLALIGTWAFNFSPSFYYYTINPLPDNLALCLSVWGLVMFQPDNDFACCLDELILKKGSIRIYCLKKNGVPD
ncbi:MAG: glycosyltransferase family 39 protein [Bacteroidota bacterium]